MVLSSGSVVPSIRNIHDYLEQHLAVLTHSTSRHADLPSPSWALRAFSFLTDGIKLLTNIEMRGRFAGRILSKHVGRIRKIAIQICAAFVVGVFFTHVFIRRYSGAHGAPRQLVGSRQTVIELRDPSEHIKVDDTNFVMKEELLSFESHTHAKQSGQDVLADILYNRVRILCWVLTSPQNLQKKTIHVQATWARRCNKVIFISSQDDSAFPTVKVDAPEGRDYLWRKTRGAFQYVYDHHLDDADWFLKADDDTYVVLENLRFMLADKSPEEPVYFGRRFNRYVQQGYMSGGAGYVLSRLALILVVEKAFPNRNVCRDAAKGKGIGAQEDIEMGKCLANVGVVAGDSRDGLEKETFHPFQPEILIIPNLISATSWFWKYVYYPTQSGPECCSDYTISFHYISPNTMYLLEYMIYHMRPFGIGHYTCPANMDAILGKIHPEDRLGEQLRNGEVNAMNNEVKDQEKVVRGQAGDKPVGDDKGAVQLMQ